MLALSGNLRSAPPFSVSRSLRFRTLSNTASLSRTFATPTNQTTFTFSAWVKNTSLGSNAAILAVSNTDGLFFNTTGNIVIYIANVIVLTSSSVQRDPASWMHIVWKQVGSQQSVWVNNNLVLSGTASGSPVNSAVVHRIGAQSTSGAYFDGYLTEVNFVDGGDLTPSAFAETNATTGVWTPKKFTGAYGNNGFYLKFTDASGATATTIGKDFSGKYNNWTPSGISVTAGSSYDSMYDTPLNNYPVLNALTPSKVISTLNGYLTAKDTRTSGLSGDYCLGNFEADPAFAKKWYFEATFIQSGTPSTTYYPAIGFNSQNLIVTNLSNAIAYRADGQKSINGTVSAYGASYVSGDVIGIALDQTVGSITFYKNGVSQGIVATGVTSILYPLFYLLHTSTWATQYDCNFGQYPFVYTPPAGHTDLSYANFPAPTVVNGASVITATAYTGTGSALTITNTSNNASFQPDFVWIKGRSNATDHALYDVVRSTTKDLVSNSTAAETTQATGLTAFNADGFGIGALGKLNTAAATYIAWQWKAGGIAVSNAVGTITSQVSANTTAGFSVMTYTGTGVNATVGHGLGVAPKMVIAKSRNNSGTSYQWVVYHSSVGASSILVLNSTSGTISDPASWNNLAPTSTVVNLGTNTHANGLSSQTVAYCFAEIAGFSKFGGYTGNGSADGPFVYCGFRPKFVMIKSSSAVGSWSILDTSRSIFNVAGITSLADTADIEGAALSIDVLSNGFKVRSAALNNTSSATYIFAAFAENSIKYALAR